MEKQLQWMALRKLRDELKRTRRCLASIRRKGRVLALTMSARMKDVAYESRAKWRAALAEVVLDHDEGPDGVCWCGEKIPCRTWRKLEETNKGIHRQVEKWASWDDKRLEEFLGEERSTHDYVIDEDEPADDPADTGEVSA
jgi:hypothetical protein